MQFCCVRCFFFFFAVIRQYYRKLIINGSRYLTPKESSANCIRCIWFWLNWGNVLAVCLCCNSYGFWLVACHHMLLLLWLSGVGDKHSWDTHAPLWCHIPQGLFNLCNLFQRLIKYFFGRSKINLHTTRKISYSDKNLWGNSKVVTKIILSVKIVKLSLKYCILW